MKRNSLSKLLRRIACALAALVIALAVAVFALWHNELTTLASFQKLSDRDGPTATARSTRSISRAITSSTSFCRRAAHPTMRS